MMIKPGISELMKDMDSRYTLAMIVAKRARDITEDAFENKIVLDEKPVKTAVDQFASGEYKFIEDPSLKA